jgi:predicted amidohydrolase
MGGRVITNDNRSPLEPSECQGAECQALAETAPAATARPVRIRTALMQIAPRLGDLASNHRLHLERIEQARQRGADLIVFPELSLTGYFLRDMVPEVALPAAAPQLRELVDAASPAALVVGFVEEGDDHRFYNSVLYAEAGRIVHVHRKVYLPTYGLFDEARYFARGTRIRGCRCACRDDYCGQMGLLVCEDFWHLSTLAILQAEAVDLLICVANSPARGMVGPRIGTAETYERLCKTYAELIGAVVVLVNRVGFEDGICFWGGSMVVGPDAEIVNRAPLLDEALVLADIDVDELRRQRLIAPLSRDERLLITIEELTRIKRARYAD